MNSAESYNSNENIACTYFSPTFFLRDACQISQILQLKSSINFPVNRTCVMMSCVETTVWIVWGFGLNLTPWGYITITVFTHASYSKSK